MPGGKPAALPPHCPMPDFAQTRFLEAVANLVPSIQKDALQRDAQIAFPQAEF